MQVKAQSPIHFNSRIERMQPSATLAMSGRAKAMRRAGYPIISLSAGEPDFDTPAPIREAAIEAIQEGFTRYTENKGIPELREAISAKLEHENGLSYSPDQIICSNGAKQSLALVINALVDEGDEVLIPAPYWVSYPEMVRMAGGEPVIVPTSVDTGYRITPEQLEEAITDRTRMLVHCSPSNPTGAVYGRGDLEVLASVLQQHPDIYVVSDEIYEYVIYDAEHVSFASLDGMRERTITVNGFSKGYAMTGWRLGYLAAEPEIVNVTAKIQSQFTSAPSSISQKAGLAALQMDREAVEKMVSAFRGRRDAVLERLRALEGVRCPTPDGAFYLFPDVSAFFGTTTPSGKEISSGDDLAFYLLEDHNVAAVPGGAFGAPDGLRMSYANSLEELTEAMDRVEAGLTKLQR